MVRIVGHCGGAYCSPLQRLHPCFAVSIVVRAEDVFAEGRWRKKLIRDTAQHKSSGQKYRPSLLRRAAARVLALGKDEEGMSFLAVVGGWDNLEERE